MLELTDNNHKKFTAAYDLGDSNVEEYISNATKVIYFQGVYLQGEYTKTIPNAFKIGSIGTTFDGRRVLVTNIFKKAPKKIYKKRGNYDIIVKTTV